MTAPAERRARRAEQILTESRAILRGDHFVYINGDHGEGWIAKDANFPDTDRASELCSMLAPRRCVHASSTSSSGPPPAA